MSAVITNATIVNDLAELVQGDEPIVPEKKARQPKRSAIVQEVVDSIHAEFIAGRAVTPHRVWATAADAKKDTNALLRHARIAAESIVVDGKQKAAARKVIPVTADIRAKRQWLASAKDGQFIVQMVLTYTKAKKDADAAPETPAK